MGKCTECGDDFNSYYCKECKKYIIGACNECHYEIQHNFITYNTGNSVHGGNGTPYKEDDAQYFPGITDRFNNS